MNTLENLNGLIGEEFDYNEIICCFEETDDEVIVNESQNSGYDYIAYENTEDSEQYLINVTDGVITGIREA